MVRDIPKNLGILEFKAIVDTSPICVAICDLDGRLLWCNVVFRQIFGPDVPVGKPINDILLQVDKHATPIGQACPPHDVQLFDKDGGKIWMSMSITVAGGVKAVRLRDIDQLRRETDELSFRENIWRNALIASRHGVWDVHIPTDRRFLSPEWRIIRGVPLDANLDKTIDEWLDRIHPDDRDAVREHSERNNAGEIDEFTLEYRERHRDGHWIWILSRGRATEWDDHGKPIRYTGTDVDITNIKNDEAKRIKEVEQAHAQTETAWRKADEMSRRDPLTGMPNRRAFSDCMDGLTSSLATLPFALILIDLDRFKPINDVHGHLVGDEVICLVSKRLSELIGDSGMTARLGGDEFGIILYGGDEVEIGGLTTQIANDISATISAPISIQDIELSIGASIGIALFPYDGDLTQNLYRAADIAMYEAKHSTRQSIASYDITMDRRHTRQARGESNLRGAVQNDEIEPYFQPIVELSTHRICGFEILARWHDPEIGALNPSFFIPRAEQQGIMLELTQSVLRSAISKAVDWPGGPMLNLNVSARDFCNPLLPKLLLDVLEAGAFDPKRLGIEITETTLLGDVETARYVSNILRAEGVRVVLDDFGTGFSGLDYLRQLELDELKIDRSFVIPMLEHAKDEAVVRSILNIAIEFGLDAVAEGIETLDIQNQLNSMGCTFGQGFLYSPALPANEVMQMLNEGQSQIRSAI